MNRLNRIMMFPYSFSLLLFLQVLTFSNLSQAQVSDLTLSPNGTDPTEPRNRLDVYLTRIEPRGRVTFCRPPYPEIWPSLIGGAWD